MSVIPFQHTLRDVKRLTEILRVLAGYGFEDFIRATGLDHAIESGRLLVGLTPQKRMGHLPTSVRLRKTLEELGPTFIKLGQVLSTRPDLVPRQWAEEFHGLQDDCPRVDFEEIRKRLDEEFDDVDALFAWIDPEPLAAASMAQTHRAEMHDGTRVVIKILRPGIRQLIEADMDVLGWLATLVESHFQNAGYSPTDVVSEFAHELKLEFDFTHEGRATDRLRRHFETDENVTFPNVYWEATTQSVLTLEEIHGTLLSHVEIDTLSEQQRRTIVKRGANAVFKQCFEFGLFHADPHPGNIFLLPDENICFIDCGMTGQIDPRTTDQLAALLYGVVNHDIERVTKAVIGLTDCDPVVTESRTFQIDVAEFLAEFEHTALGQLDMGAMLQEFFDKLRRHRIRCPSDIVFLIKAITTIEGVAAAIDSSYDIMADAKPYVEKLVRERFGPKAVGQRVQQSLLSYAELAAALPSGIQRIMNQIERNRLHVNLDHTGLDRLDRSMDQASRTLSTSMIGAAMIVGSSILMLADQLGPNSGGWLIMLGTVGFLGAGTLGVITIVSNWRKRLRIRE
jgi:ubiquinone biosynthesis protein